MSSSSPSREPQAVVRTPQDDEALLLTIAAALREGDLPDAPAYEPKDLERARIGNFPADPGNFPMKFPNQTREVPSEVRGNRRG